MLRGGIEMKEYLNIDEFLKDCEKQCFDCGKLDKLTKISSGVCLCPFCLGLATEDYLKGER